MILHCKPIFEPQTTGNWKKQLQPNWVLNTSSKDLFKSEKVNLFRESSGLSSYHVFYFYMLDMAFEISYAHALEQISKI